MKCNAKLRRSWFSVKLSVLADPFCWQFSKHRQFCLKCLLVIFSNSLLKNNTNEYKKERIKGNFVSKNVLNLSNLVSTENEIRVLDNRLNFVSTPETIDRYQIKKDLERLGRDTKLRMHYKIEPTLDFPYSRCSTGATS